MPAVLCSVTALASAILVAIRLWGGLSSGEPVSFYAIPLVLFDGSPTFGLASYLIFMVPWTIATILGCRRLFFPGSGAHRSVAGLLVPAMALNVVAYASIVSAGKPISAGNLPFGLWLIIGAITLGFLATRRTRQFEAERGGQQVTWHDANSDDGT